MSTQFILSCVTATDVKLTADKQQVVYVSQFGDNVISDGAMNVRIVGASITIDADMIDLDVDAIVKPMTGGGDGTGDKPGVLSKKIADRIGDTSSPEAGTVNASLAAIVGGTLTQRLVFAIGTDAGAVPDAGAFTAAAACRMRIKRCDTHGALISIDDGTTWLHEAIANYSEEVWYAVPVGGKIKAKNSTAGSNFADLVIEIAEVA